MTTTEIRIRIPAGWESHFRTMAASACALAEELESPAVAETIPLELRKHMDLVLAQWPTLEVMQAETGGRQAKWFVDYADERWPIKWIYFFLSQLDYPGVDKQESTSSFNTSEARKFFVTNGIRIVVKGDG